MSWSADGRDLSINVGAHVYPEHEISLSTQDSGTHVLGVGSVQYNSPSCGKVTLFFQPDGTDLRRLRDAISQHLGDTDSDLVRRVTTIRDALMTADNEAVAANEAGMLAPEVIYNDLSVAVAVALAHLGELLPGGAS